MNASLFVMNLTLAKKFSSVQFAYFATLNIKNLNNYLNGKLARECQKNQNQEAYQNWFPSPENKHRYRSEN